MDSRKWQIAGLSGFIITGILYTISSINSGDLLITAGNIIWLLACICLLIPLLLNKSL